MGMCLTALSFCSCSQTQSRPSPASRYPAGSRPARSSWPKLAVRAAVRHQHAKPCCSKAPRSMLVKNGWSSMTSTLAERPSARSTCSPPLGKHQRSPGRRRCAACSGTSILARAWPLPLVAARAVSRRGSRSWRIPAAARAPRGSSGQCRAAPAGLQRVAPVACEQVGVAMNRQTRSVAGLHQAIVFREATRPCTGPGRDSRDTPRQCRTRLGDDGIGLRHHVLVAQAVHRRTRTLRTGRGSGCVTRNWYRPGAPRARSRCQDLEAAEREQDHGPGSRQASRRRASSREHRRGAPPAEIANDRNASHGRETQAKEQIGLAVCSRIASTTGACDGYSDVVRVDPIPGEIADAHAGYAARRAIGNAAAECPRPRAAPSPRRRAASSSTSAAWPSSRAPYASSVARMFRRMESLAPRRRQARGRGTKTA